MTRIVSMIMTEFVDLGDVDPKPPGVRRFRFDYLPA